MKYYVFLQWDKRLKPIVRVNTIKGLQIQLEKLGCEIPSNLEELFEKGSNQYVGKTDKDEDVYVCEILGWDYEDDL